jgi:hypothetical protein
MRPATLLLVTAVGLADCKIEKIPAAAPFSDDFQRAQLGDAWNATGPNYRIVDGELVIDHAYNHPLWLKQPIPENAVIELDCWSNDDAGDLKIEAWGDGRSYAQTASYTATSYVFIFGGWHNRESRIAKLDEHALTAQQMRAQLALLARPYASSVAGGIAGLWELLSGAWQRNRARADLERMEKGTFYGEGTPVVVRRGDLRVERNRVYRVRLTRKGDLLRWENDGQLVLELRDQAGLSGPGHDRFGFSSWQNDTWFDNLRIEPL